MPNKKESFWQLYRPVIAATLVTAAVVGYIAFNKHKGTDYKPKQTTEQVAKEYAPVAPSYNLPKLEPKPVNFVPTQPVALSDDQTLDYIQNSIAAQNITKDPKYSEINEQSVKDFIADLNKWCLPVSRQKIRLRLF
ncbi:MAG: hypothetical protein NT120_02420 [Candidatus Aenigmarchaeota archaeon]|nr:hypothetical protein [Candidatus Aenigmarchaeota archaeon]